MRVFGWFLVLFLRLPFFATAQQLHFNSRTFEYNNEPLKVKKLYQDRQGFMWLGTSQGLFQYDGLVTKPVLRLKSRRQIPPVSAIFQDKRQQLWAACENGQIFFLRNGGLQLFAPDKTMPKEAILAIHEDANGYIWFATYGEGLYCWKNKQLYHFSTADGLPDDYIYTITSDNEGDIWAGTDRGIAICNFETAKKHVRKIGVEQGLPDNIVTALAACPEKRTIWAGTHAGGFCLIDAATGKITLPQVAKNWDNGVISEILPVTANSGIIATYGHGLWEYCLNEPNRLVSLSNDLTFNNQKITDLLEDAEGLTWAAGNVTEVKMANPVLRFLSHGTDSPTGIHAVLADRKTNIWYSTDEGLFCVRRQNSGMEIKPVFTALPFRKYKIISMFEDAHGFLWLGTFGGGVYRLDPATGKARQITEKNGLANDNVLSITGSKREIWLATLGGASRCKLNADPTAPLTFESFNQQDGIGFNYIYQVFADSKNRIWFATDGKGLTKLDNGRFTNYSEKDGLTARTVYSIAETKDGNLWVSTPKNGLFKFDGRQFTNFSTKQGLSDLNISSLSTDKFGNLLVLHKKGLDLLEPGSGKIRYLGTESGLPTTEQNLNAITKDEAGTVWFGAPKVIAAYQPVSGEKPAQPRMRLASVQLFLKPVSAQPNQFFAYNENHISFEYAGLWYQNPEEVRYRLKLEGYDREWTYSNNRSITYPKLPPGKYTFKVSASTTGNFKNAPQVTYPFEVAKSFWDTAWFYLLGFTCSGGLLFGLVKSREKRLKNAERLEKDKVMFQFETLKNQVNPHFLFNSFNTLIGIIEDDQEAAVAYVEKLSDFFRDILVYREKDTITLREELVLIQNYYFLQQKRYGSNLRMQINVPETEQDLWIAPLTLQLLVENAIKHNVVSKDKPLLVEIFTESDLYLTVRNTLQKKKMPQSSTGIGLANIRNRYAILGNKLVFITENADYFEVKVPLFSR